MAQASYPQPIKLLISINILDMTTEYPYVKTNTDKTPTSPTDNIECVPTKTSSIHIYSSLQFIHKRTHKKQVRYFRQPTNLHHTQDWCNLMHGTSYKEKRRSFTKSDFHICPHDFYSDNDFTPATFKILTYECRIYGALTTNNIWFHLGHDVIMAFSIAHNKKAKVISTIYPKSE